MPACITDAIFSRRTLAPLAFLPPHSINRHYARCDSFGADCVRCELVARQYRRLLDAHRVSKFMVRRWCAVRRRRCILQPRVVHHGGLPWVTIQRGSFTPKALHKCCVRCLCNAFSLNEFFGAVTQGSLRQAQATPVHLKPENCSPTCQCWQRQ